MNKLNIKVILSVIALVFVMTSCFEDDNDENKYDGPALVEFNAPTLTTGSYVRNVNVGVGLVTEQVNLISPHFSTDQTIMFTVDGANSTAVEGTHYSIDGTFTIAANSSIGNADIQILNGAIPAGESRTVVLVLQGNDLIGVSENYKSVRFVIRP
tara:strand:- start:2326 stop:2790 length:465 start_codon:yes stop_codon:yes gene_type:complete